MRDREHRQALILEILLREQVTSQIDLVERLRAEGLRPNQATISRDLRQLRIEKRGGVYVVPESAGGGSAAHRHLTTVLGEHLRSIEVAENLLVLRTAPAMAPAVARALDERSLPGVAGTVAGRDTVLVALVSRSASGWVSGALSRAWGSPAKHS